MDNGISIIICCYNSSLRIADTLRHVFVQKIKFSIHVEIIIVNNNCTDNTIEVVQNIWIEAKSNFKLIIVDESKPGLTYARKKGVFTASHEIIIFCDDDNWLEENYLQIAFDQMVSDCTIGALGGQGIAISDVEIPHWFYKVQSGYACGQQFNHNGIIPDFRCLWGAGLVSRRSILRIAFSCDFPFILSDRSGINLSSGGDSEICKRIFILGFKLFYNSNLVYTHFIPSNRIDDYYLTNLKNSFKVSYPYLLMYDYVVLRNKYSNFGYYLFVVKYPFIFFKIRHEYPNLFRFYYYCFYFPNYSMILKDVKRLTNKLYYFYQTDFSLNKI